MDTGPRSGGWRWTVALAAFALALRLLVLALACASAPADAAGVAALHDGREYQLAAAALRPGAGGAADLPPAARRLAPGYPLLVLVASALLPMPAAALAVAALGAALAAGLLHRLGLSPAAVALFAVLTPSWIVFTATAMSEGPFVAFALGGLLAWRYAERPRGAADGLSAAALVAGLAFGAAALVRPVGTVLFAALGLVRAGRRPWPGLLCTTAGFVLPPAAWLVAVRLREGGWPGQLAVYLRSDAAPPLASLAAGLARPQDDPLKWLQTVLVLALVLAAGALLWRRRRHLGDAGTADWLAWLGSQLLFYLLLPSVWVFECLARFLVPVLPAVAAAAEPLLPPPGRRRRAVAAVLVGVLAAGGVGVSLWWTLRALGAP